MFESGVGAHAAGARDIAEAAEGVQRLPRQDGGPGEPVVHHGVAQGQFGDLGDVGRNGPQLSGVGQRLQRDRAGADGAAQQPMSGDGGVEPQQLFSDALSMCVGQTEPDIVGQRAQVGDVVVEPFEFDEQGPQPVHLVGKFDPERVFDGEAVGERVRDGGVAADAFGQFDRAARPAGPAKSFSMPRWTNHSRALSRSTVSPATEKRKWPGSISPACTGPTGISYTPGPSTVTNGK